MSTNEHKMSTNNLKYSCDFCDLTFKSKPNKRRHELHYCEENNVVHVFFYLDMNYIIVKKIIL